MAAIALPAVLGFEAGTLSYFAAFAAGMYLDANVLGPRLFGSTNEGPKLDDLPVGRWTEGTALPVAYGKAAHVPGTVIWQSPIKEVKDTSSGGGKGGSGGEFVQYKYYADIAVALCAGPVNRVTKLYADGKLIYNVAPDIDFTSTQIEGDVTTVTPYSGSTIYYLTLTSSGGGSPDLSTIKSGKLVEVSDGTNSGSYECVSSNTDVVAGTTWCKVRLGATADGFTDWSSGAKTVTLYQELPVFSGKHMSGVRFHLGTADQEPDPLIESYEGDDNVPGYRDTCYVIFESLALFDWGNRIPSFSAVVEEDIDRTVPEVIRAMLEYADIDPGEYDLSGLDDAEFEGFTKPGVSSTSTDLQPILISEDIAIQQIDNTVFFKQRDDIVELEIPATDIGHSYRRESWLPYVMDDEDDRALPDEVNVKYVDINNDYDTGSQRHKRLDTNSRETITVDLPLAMETTKARGIAARLLWLALQGREVEFTLPPWYRGTVFESSLLRITLFSQSYGVRVTQLERGANQSLRVMGRLEEPITPVSVGEEAIVAASTSQNPTFVAPSIELRMFNARPLREDDTLTPGVYVAACCPDPNTTFAGAAVFESIDGGTTYDQIMALSGAAYIGDVDSYTGSTVSGASWDTVNEITVTMMHGELETRTDAAVLNGANRALFGEEIIAYANVEYLGDNQYKLSRLLRGLRGTSTNIDDTKTGVSFVQLNQPGVHFLPTPSGSIGSARLYKAVAAGGHLEEAYAWSFTAEGRTVLPLPPANVTASRDGSDNLSLSWVPVSRALGRIFGVTPQLDRLEDYQVEYMDASRTTTYRTRTRQETRDDTYTAAEQTSDGAAPGDTIIARITPYSDFHGYHNNNYVEVTIS